MDLVSVRVRDCACPNTPHREEGDCVFLPAKPSLTVGLQTQVDLADSRDAAGRISAADLQRRWLITYATHAIEGWNLTDERGKPIPYDPSVLLADYEMALAAADKADDLYREAILRPLGLRPSATSQPGQTGDSTSPAPRSIRKPRGSSSRATSAVTAP